MSHTLTRSRAGQARAKQMEHEDIAKLGVESIRMRLRRELIKDPETRRKYNEWIRDHQQVAATYTQEYRGIMKR